MTTLLNLQFRLSRSIMDNRDIIGPWMTETETPALSIYSNAYRIRLKETLVKDYPALAVLLGDETFSMLADEYSKEHPSESYTLRYYGRHLSDFLGVHPDYRLQTYLAELAAFEWQLTDVFDLEDTPVATIEFMNDIPVEAWPDLTIKLVPSVRCLDFNWNINEIYPALRDTHAVPDFVRQAQPTQYLIWRQNNSPHYRILDSNEWLALKSLQRNNFSELCLLLSKISKTPENAPLEAATFLKSWLAAGLIESVNYLDLEG